MPASAKKTVAQRIEQAVEQNHDQQKADRDDHFKAGLRPLEVFELAGPNDAIANRQLYVFADALLRFGNRATKIAIAHTELHGNIAFSRLVIDEGGASIERDVGEFAEWNIGINAGGRRIADFEIPDGFEIRPILGWQANLDGK
jgi:hypothetical protein